LCLRCRTKLLLFASSFDASASAHVNKNRIFDLLNNIFFRLPARERKNRNSHSRFPVFFLLLGKMQRASNFAEALVACNHPPPAKKIAKKRDLNTKIKVLADLSNESGETQRQVAQKHGISERLVRRIKHIAKKSQEEHVDWYRMPAWGTGRNPPAQDFRNWATFNVPKKNSNHNVQFSESSFSNALVSQP